jgi:hypothetical protein
MLLSMNIRKKAFAHRVPPAQTVPILKAAAETTGKLSHKSV